MVVIHTSGSNSIMRIFHSAEYAMDTNVVTAQTMPPARAHARHARSLYASTGRAMYVEGGFGDMESNCA